MNLFESVLCKLGLQVRITSDVTSWTPITRAGTGPADLDWYTISENIKDATEAWRTNFLIRQIVRLTTAYVVGDGIAVTSSHSWAAKWLETFWNDPQNNITQRLPQWCDELTRTGDLFIALFSNRVTGMQYVRAIPSASIETVLTNPEDYEDETGYLEIIPGQVERKRWTAAAHAEPDAPCILHLSVNKPIGATRGESDLTPVLPWAMRYTEWLKERTRFNRIRNELSVMHIEVQSDADVAMKRAQYESNPPTGGSIMVTGPGEKISFPAANINAYDAAPDGLALRLAFAAGANIPLHFLGEGSSATRSTAAEMGDPTHRHYRMRQQAFGGHLVQLAQTAYQRRTALTGYRTATDPDIRYVAPDISRDDNGTLATATAAIVTALATMKAQGWIDSETAVKLIFKFAGENITAKEIETILEKAKNEPKPDLSTHTPVKGNEKRPVGDNADQGREDSEPKRDNR